MVTDNNRCTEGKLLALKSALLFFEDDNARSTNVTRLRLVDIRPGEKVSFAPSFRVGWNNFVWNVSFLVRPIVSWLFEIAHHDDRRYQKKIFERERRNCLDFLIPVLLLHRMKQRVDRAKSSPVKWRGARNREREREERESSSMFNIQ